MMNIFTSLIEAKNLTTYKVGLLQTKAYRKMNQKTSVELKPFDISPIEWAFIGIIHEVKDIRLNEAAKILGVEAPFITALIPKFEKNKVIEYIEDLEDKRAKKIRLTKKGHDLVVDIEKVMRANSKKWLEGVSIKDILAFIRVLKKLGEE